MKPHQSLHPVDGIVRTGRPRNRIPPCADRKIGDSAGLMARLFLFKLVRNHAIGDALVRRHAAYCEPLACERNEPAMIHRRLALEPEHSPALRIDIE
jgi:hypothetical protein